MTWQVRSAEVLMSRRFLWAVVVGAFLLRAAWGISAGDEQRFYDSDSYVKIADNILAGNGFLWGDQRVGRPPLYPLFVAATRTTLFGREFALLYLLQAALSAGTILVFAASARRLLGDIAAGVTAALLALDPFLIFHTGTVLSETLFIFFLALLFLGTVLLIERPGAALLLTGAAGAGAVLTRPSALLLVAVFAALVAVFARPRVKAFSAAFGVVVLTLLLIFPWALRNHRVTGHWVFTTLGVGASLYDGVGPQADGSSDMEFLNTMDELAGMDEFARDRYLRGKALEAAREEPWRVVKLAAVKMRRFWSPVPNSDRFRSPLYYVVSLAAVMPVYILAFAAIIGGAVSARTFVVLMAGPGYFTLLHAIFVGSARYRTPVMAFVVILGAAWAGTFLSKSLGAPSEGETQDGG